MAERRPQRQFAFIVHADVVASTALVRSDEERAHERIQGRFRILADAVSAYGGSVKEIRGDALVAMFGRASDAVGAVLRFQQGNRARNVNLADTSRPEVRIGVGMGEVVVADRTVTGPGVILAQRLEQLAEPGGVVIQGAVRETMPRRLPFVYTDVGPQKLKGFEDPVQAYRVALKPGASVPEPEKNRRWGSRLPRYLPFPWPFAAIAALTLAVGGLVIAWAPWELTSQTPAREGATVAKRSIAVLPFDNLSGDPEQEYFSDGISEDLITDLARLAEFNVIAPNSSFSYKGTPVGAQDIGEALQVQYVLEGSVRKSGDRLRITAQLIETNSGHQLWAERYDRELAEVFAMQDEITRRIVTALSIQLSEDEQRFVDRRATNSFAAYDLFLQARQFDRFTVEGAHEAARLYRQAIGLDPEFARAYGALAVNLARQVVVGYSDSPAESLERALMLARKAVSIDPTSPHTQWALGYVHMRQRQFDEAVRALEQALSLSPNFADGYALLALIRNNLGQAEEAIALVERAMELNPFYGRDYLYNLGRAYYTLGDYEAAVRILGEALERNETSREIRLFLAASYVGLGRQDDAEWEIAQLQTTHPELNLSHIRKVFPFGNDELRDRFFDDLLAAGVTE